MNQIDELKDLILNQNSRISGIENTLNALIKMGGIRLQTRKKRWLTVKEISEIENRTVRSIYTHLENKRIERKLKPNSNRVLWVDYDSYLEHHKHTKGMKP